MSDTEYWKARCRRAEGLLAKARSGIYVTEQRRAVLLALGGLRPGQWLSTDALQRLAGVKHSHLAAMQELGLVVSRPMGGCNKSEWQLEHLVVPAEEGEQG